MRLFTHTEKATTLALGPAAVGVAAVFVSAVTSNDLGFNQSVVLTLAQVIPALMLALVFGTAIFQGSTRKEHRNLAWGAASTLLIGAIGETACFVMTGRDHYHTFWGPLAATSAFVLLGWLVAVPVLAAEMGRSSTQDDR